MTDQDIIDYFDSRFQAVDTWDDATVAEIARMSGKSVSYVEHLLMGS